MKKVVCLISIFLIILIRIFYINIYKGDLYVQLLKEKSENYVYENNAPRGRILDRNGKVLVDNKGVKTLYYTKQKNITLKEEIEIANYLANILNVQESVNLKTYKNYWLLLNDNGEDLITTKEKNLISKRKITSDEIKKIKYERITLEMLDNIDKESATIYELMNKGYSYDRKLIVSNVDDKIYSKIIDENISGLSFDITWERIYNYGDTLKDIFGTIGSIPKEKINDYLKKGYTINDTVGLSYLELEYEEYLKGEKDLYKINKDNTRELIKKGKNGNDLVLSIDIDVQIKLDSIIQENILKAKKYKYTDYFSESYSIVGNPNTGEIIAFSGQKLLDLDTKTFKNVNTNLINTSYTVGSIVKMATLSTGYKYGVVDIGTKMRDGCIKLYQVPLKCSYKDLGVVSDLTAISRSSNYYQFKIALGITGAKYNYNMKLSTTNDDFNKFRNMFGEYGLGSKTGIDLPNETVGIIGKNTSSDLLLNLSIGQYDTYTPIELFQYVNTIASGGLKKTPMLMNKIKDDKNVILENKFKTVSQVSLRNEYLIRIKEAMHLATTSGTARNYIAAKYKPAGKTGTSETFIDTNNDNIMDTKTTSIGFVGFAPYNDPKYSVIVLAPNLYIDNDSDYSKVYITRYISRDITNFLFENR